MSLASYSKGRVADGLYKERAGSVPGWAGGVSQ